MKKYEKLCKLRHAFCESFYGRAPKFNRYKQKRLDRLEKWWGAS